MQRCNVRQETGAVMIELAMCAPLLFLLTICVFDVGNGLISQATLSSVARDGTLLSGRVSNLANISCEHDGTSFIVENSSPPVVCANTTQHPMLLRLIWQLLQADRPTINLVDDLKVISRYDPTTQTVTVEIRGHYTALLYPFTEMNLSAQATGSYL